MSALATEPWPNTPAPPTPRARPDPVPRHLEPVATLSSSNLGLDSSPRLRVDIWRRADGVHQVGLDVEGGVQLRAHDRLAAALGELDGHCTLAQAARRARVSPHELVQVVDQLPHQLLDRGRATARAIRIIGAGHLGKALAEMLSPAGDASPLILVDPDPPPPGLYPQRHPTAAQCLKAHLQARGHSQVGTNAHWWDAPSEPTLTVVAVDRPECDRVLTNGLVRDDQPHLVIRLWRSGAVVGPFVMPGTTSCLRCADLVRGTDPAWPKVLAQACRADVRPPTPHIQWAAAVAVIQLTSWLQTGSCQLLDQTHELSDVGGQALRRWAMHPDCGCAGL